MAGSAIRRVNGLYTVHQQIDDYLLEMNAISNYQRQVVCQILVERYATLVNLASDQRNRLTNELVNVQWIRLQFALLAEGADTPNDFARSLAVADDMFSNIP